MSHSSLTRSGAAAFAAMLLAAAPALAKPRTIDNAELKYSVVVPAECRTEEGPGTLEAICAPDMDEAKSVEIATATALLLEVDAEAVPTGAKPYTETEFRQDVPEAVCGESDNPKTRLEAVKVARDGEVTIFTATITCSAIKFLGLPERRADIRYLMGPTIRYRLMARSLVDDVERTKDARAVFLTSFKPGPGKSP